MCMSICTSLLTGLVMHLTYKSCMHLPEVTHTRDKLLAPFVLGQPKVSNLEAGQITHVVVHLAIQQKIVRLEVKVDYAHLMQVS